ncbi:MAG: ferredoxin-type protein NapF [Gammaproteobacteria bacterium]|nr:ferredoxin-type protein NapF [Gammaproteobacteria bacterium]
MKLPTVAELSPRQQTGAWRRGVQRPPWTDETAIRAHCTSCGDCRDACPEAILFEGPAGTPMLDFRSGSCTFCQACVEACSEPVFFDTAQKPWNLIAVPGESCLLMSGVSCRSCTGFCDHEALKFDLRVKPVGAIIVNSESCTGCGACISVCPSDAISMSSVVEERLMT